LIHVLCRRNLNTVSCVHKRTRACVCIRYCKGNGFAWIPDLDSLFDWNPHASKCDMNAEMLGDAFKITGAIYGCFFIAGLLAPTENIFWLASFVQVGVLALTAQYWLARFGFGPFLRTFDLVYVQIGLVIYSVKVAVDTAMIKTKYWSGDRDVVSHALTQLTNILQLFIRVITILAEINKEAKRKRN
jgi:hypothetical protein